jgi:hypothetical protein
VGIDAEDVKCCRGRQCKVVKNTSWWAIAHWIRMMLKAAVIGIE